MLNAGHTRPRGIRALVSSLEAGVVWRGHWTTPSTPPPAVPCAARTLRPTWPGDSGRGFLVFYALLLAIDREATLPIFGSRGARPKQQALQMGSRDPGPSSSFFASFFEPVSHRVMCRVGHLSSNPALRETNRSLCQYGLTISHF